MKRFLLFFALVVALSPGGNRTSARAAAAATTAPATQPAPPPFFIGVWQQPKENFPTWIARGCNCLWDAPTGSTWTPAVLQQWVAAAEQLGLWQIRQPIGTLAADNATPHLVAWNQPDEPDYNAVPASTLSANYLSYKAVAPKRPVFLNCDGSRVLGYQGGLTQANYTPLLTSGDWLGTDVYPYDWGLQSLVPLSSSGSAVARMLTWSGAKPQFAFIETSQQLHPASLTPTLGAVRYESYNAIFSGVTGGICFFPCQFGPGGVFTFDGTPPEIAAGLPQLSAELLTIAPYLGSGFRGSSSPAQGFLYATTTSSAGQLNLLFNDTPAAAVYDGVTLAPWGAYAVLVAPAGNKVILQTPLPSSPQQQIAALQAQVLQQGAALNAIAKAAATTQP
jgi:hypothetical protein